MDFSRNSQHPAPSPSDYDFILQHGESQRTGRSRASGSKKGRILVVLGGAVALIVAAVTITSLLSGGDTISDDLLKAAQQQAELIRVAEIGINKARDPVAQNFAATTKATLESQQPSTNELLKKFNVPSNPKLIAQGQDPKTNTLLEQAEQTNQFDSVFTKTLSAHLTAYQQSLKIIYESTASKSAKQTLNEQHKQVSVLLAPPTPAQTQTP